MTACPALYTRLSPLAKAHPQTTAHRTPMQFIRTSIANKDTGTDDMQAPVK